MRHFQLPKFISASIIYPNTGLLLTAFGIASIYSAGIDSEEYLLQRIQQADHLGGFGLGDHDGRDGPGYIQA